MSTSNTRPSRHLRYIVTTYSASKKDKKVPIRSQVWNSKAPLTLGHPFKWILEKVPSGVRIRNISAVVNQTQNHTTQEVPEKNLKKGLIIDLPLLPSKSKDSNSVATKVEIQPAQELAPAFHHPKSHLENNKSHSLVIFSCFESWIRDTQNIQESSNSTGKYTGRLAKQKVFALKTKGNSAEIQSFEDKLFLEKAGQKQGIPKGKKLEVRIPDLLETTIRLGSQNWRFNLAPVSHFEDKVRTTPEQVEETRRFKKALSVSGAVATAFILFAVLWPKPEVEEKEEIIPAQYAKIVLQKPKDQPAAPAAAPLQGEAKPTRAQDTAVAQAFRAQALQSAVKGLLKGGMTSLLAQSDLVSASRNSRLLGGSKSNRAALSSVNQNLKNARNVKISSLGGKAGKGKVGYQSGKKAGISGQGSSFVALDTGGLLVDQGLSKDEVGRVIHKHLSEVRYCYESAMLRNPDIQGKLIVDFVIGKVGRVTTSSVQKSTLPDPRLDDCILRRLARWKFPKPKGGVNVAVSYPFIFKTLGR